jgi:glycosyltransferase involved in cell wall biosynthesis
VGAGRPAGRIAYVMSRFPHRPETFIAREMAAVERRGWAVAPFPLIRQRPALAHGEARQWLGRVQPLRPLSWRFAGDNLGQLLGAPRRTLALWRRMVGELRSSPAFLARGLYLFPLAVHAAARMRRMGIEHIHAHYASHPALVAWLIHHLAGISYSVTAHAHDIFVNHTMLATKMHDAAFVVAISEYNHDYLTRFGGDRLREKTRVIHCGIDPGRYAAEPIAPTGRLEIVNVGSLQPYKGQQYLVAACAELRRQGIPFRCRIVGEGEERPRLERLIAAGRLADEVFLLGARTEDEVAALLATANCYVQPSVVTPAGKMEGIPVALMEALAAGLPVVASRLSGIPELVRPGETGYLVPPADAPALAAALAHVWRCPQEAAALALAGRRLVYDEFNLEKSSRQLSALFATVLEKMKWSQSIA